MLDFLQGLRGSLWVTFEEGTSAAWLYDGRGRAGFLLTEMAQLPGESENN